MSENKNYIFENDILRYESYMHRFTDSLFNELDSKSKEINLTSTIADLINGEKVNYSEDQAAWHPKYRKRDSYVNSFKFPELGITSIVVLGIGGSFEGPKLLIESLSQPTDNPINHIFITGSDPYEFKEKMEKYIT